MATGTPPRITPTIRKLCWQIDQNGAPVYLELQVMPGAIVDDCFENVRKKILKDGGSAQYGWRIWEWPKVLVEAEFHAVWKSPDDALVDVSPAPGVISRVLFMPDPFRAYEGKQVDNIRTPLDDNELTREFIAVNERIFEEMNRGELAYQHGAVSIPSYVIDPLRRRKLELVRLLLAKKVGRNEPCRCGSGQKYKKCCGR